MKVYYDDQIFRYQTTGGIKNYFINLIWTFLQHPAIGIQPVLSDFAENIIKQELNSIISKPSKSDHYLELIRKKYLRNNPLTVDLIHHTFYFKAYLGSNSSVPRVSTIHDMIPEKLTRSFLINPHFSKALYIKDSDYLISVSDATKMDLLAQHPYAFDKTETIHLGYSILDSEKINLDFTNFFLYVGKRNSYKKASDLFRAFSTNTNSANTVLILVGGGKINYSEKLLLKKLKILDRVHQTNPNNNQLMYLMKNAISLICTSEDEGFHLPTLDALSQGTPVIVRDIEIFKELYGQNVLKFKTVNELSLLMSEVKSRNYKFPEILKKQVKELSWINCAKKTADFYRISMEK